MEERHAREHYLGRQEKDVRHAMRNASHASRHLIPSPKSAPSHDALGKDGKSDGHIYRPYEARDRLLPNGYSLGAEVDRGHRQDRKDHEHDGYLSKGSGSHGYVSDRTVSHKDRTHHSRSLEERVSGRDLTSAPGIVKSESGKPSSQSEKSFRLPYNSHHRHENSETIATHKKPSEVFSHSAASRISYGGKDGLLVPAYKDDSKTQRFEEPPKLRSKLDIEEDKLREARAKGMYSSDESDFEDEEDEDKRNERLLLVASGPPLPMERSRKKMRYLGQLGITTTANRKGGFYLHIMSCLFFSLHLSEK